jgi:steroid delta-isomerase-like uncharacterized protein
MATSQMNRLLEDLAAAWTVHDIETVLKLCTDDCVYEDVPMGVVNRGKAELRRFAGAVLTAFPDFKMELTSGFTTGNWAGAEWTMSGTHQGDLPGMPATGKRFLLRGSSICELHEGKIKRNSDYWDMVTFLRQIGLMP